MSDVISTKETPTSSSGEQVEQNPLAMPRLVAIMGGDDWVDARVNHVAIPNGMDLETERKSWRKWYIGRYRPLLNTENRVDYVSFLDWIKRKGAREATEIEEFWEI